MAEPREEIEQLLNFLLPVAEEQLSKAGEFDKGILASTAR